MNDVVAVLGASGFVGMHVCRALQDRGMRVRSVAAPRLRVAEDQLTGEFVIRHSDDVRRLSEQLSGVRSVVNAAGIGEALSDDYSALIGANAALPLLGYEAALRAGAKRYIHISSAAVQGRRAVLDDSEDYDPFSRYSHSKVLGERLLLENGTEGLVIYRPPGVHSSDRSVTISLTRLARSRAIPLPFLPHANAPHAQAGNVGDALAYLAACDETPPVIVHHPSERISPFDLIQQLGGQRPITIPPQVARLVTSILRAPSIRSSRLSATLRRLEVLWFGQGQAPSWLEGRWDAPQDLSGWHETGLAIRSSPRRVLIVATVPEQIRVQYPHHLRHFSEVGTEVRVATSGDCQPYLRHGETAIRLPLERGGGIRTFIQSFWHLMRESASFRPDLVIFGSPVASLCASLATRLTSPRRICVVHGLREETLTGTKRFAVSFLSRLTYTLSSDVVFCSPSSAQQAKLGRFLSRRADVAPGGFVGLDLHDGPGRTPRRNIPPYVIGFVGRIAKDKGIDDLVTAAAGLPDTKLVLVGEFDEADPIAVDTRRLIFDRRNIHWVGHHNNPLPWYELMDVFCLPSYREGLPTAILEAFQKRVPVVAYRSTGIIDIVTPATGWLTSSRDAASLSTTLRIVLDGPLAELTKRVGEAERIARATYSTDSVMHWWINKYAQGS